MSIGSRTNSPSLLALQGGISMKSQHLGGRDRKAASSRPDNIIRLGSYLKKKKSCSNLGINIITMVVHVYAHM